MRECSARSSCVGFSVRVYFLRKAKESNTYSRLRVPFPPDLKNEKEVSIVIETSSDVCQNAQLLASRIDSCQRDNKVQHEIGLLIVMRQVASSGLDESGMRSDRC